jgi:cell division protein FtsZ
MGTGEASGEKRALSAAEAAISNPLIDDASMKGAKGLLISITGGKDLTLYEVDEAATRIREEVDQDANIIVGATFDEALDGVIRVSVVATGIDQASLSRSISAPEARIAELTQKLRADQMRAEQQRPMADRAEQKDVRALSAAAAGGSAAQQTAEAIEMAAKAAVARAVLPLVEDVTVRPIPPKPSLFLEPSPAMVEAAAPKAFIPPAPERLPNRPRRMPEFDELPRPAQAELRARRGEHSDTEHPEKRKGGLLRRLAAVGLGRRDEEEEADKAASNIRPVRPPSRPAERAQGGAGMAAPAGFTPPRPSIPAAASAPVAPVSEYAKRPAHQPLDALGRQAATHPEEDQLDIPAFLRRQAN